jgi:nitric oxide dioxygenase
MFGQPHARPLCALKGGLPNWYYLCLFVGDVAQGPDRMTEDQKTLIRLSFARIAPDAEAVAGQFYERLFILDPKLRPLFTGDMKEQGRKLMAMISVAVAHLDNLDAIVPAVQQLGARHAGYGVRRESYSTVGDALAWTLAQGLGPDYTAEMAAAWSDCYATVAAVMQQGAALA